MLVHFLFKMKAEVEEKTLEILDIFSHQLTEAAWFYKILYSEKMLFQKHSLAKIQQIHCTVNREDERCQTKC